MGVLFPKLIFISRFLAGQPSPQSEGSFFKPKTLDDLGAGLLPGSQGVFPIRHHLSILCSVMLFYGVLRKKPHTLPRQSASSQGLENTPRAFATLVR